MDVAFGWGNPDFAKVKMFSIYFSSSTITLKYLKFSI